jgi:hypothetical protein
VFLFLAHGIPYDGAEGQRWIGKQYNLVDDEGYFTEFDGSRSRVIHQYDRLGWTFSDHWLKNQDFVQDPFPPPQTEPPLTPIAPPLSADDAGSTNNETSVRRTTDTGVDVSDPELFEEVDLHGDSSTATVMGMASGYELPDYQRFIGSLRKSGFKGNIILGRFFE